MRRFAIGAVLLSATLAVAGVLMVAVKTERTLHRGQVEVADEAKIAFELSTLDRATSRFAHLGAASRYTSGVVFQGKTVLAGADGLTIGTAGQPDARQLRVGEDLPAAQITGMAVGAVRGDARQRLIVATRGEGLLFLDDVNGGTIRQLRPKEATLRDVTAVAVLASGEFLIGTRDKGLLRYDGKMLRYFSPALTGVPVTAIAVNEAEFWVGTRDRGAFRWHAGQLDHFDRESGIPDELVESIAFHDDKTFVGTPMGVVEFASGKFNLNLTGVFGHAMAFFGDSLYVGTPDQGVYELATADVIREHRSIRPIAAEPMKAESFLVAEGELLAVSASGLVRHEASGEWRPLPADTPLPSVPVLADGNVSALSFAPDGRLWVGYFDHGLDVVNLATGAVRHTEDDHVFCVNRVVGDVARGTMDVATANGLVLFDTAGRERQVMMRKDGLIADQVTDVAFTKNGTVLATPSGITFIDSGGVSSLYGFQGLVNNHVYALATDAASGTLMAGTLGGISVLGNTAVLRDAAVRRNLTTKNSGLKQNWITAIVAVPSFENAGRQRWFVGTYGGGVVELGADGQFAAMDGAISEAGRAMVVNPNAMLVTERHVFAGSLGDGLFVYDLANGRWSQVKAGLPSLNVTAFAERDGELYVGTENGVVHVAESRLAP